MDIERSLNRGTERATKFKHLIKPEIIESNALLQDTFDNVNHVLTVKFESNAIDNCEQSDSKETVISGGTKNSNNSIDEESINAASRQPSVSSANRDNEK